MWFENGWMDWILPLSLPKTSFALDNGTANFFEPKTLKSPPPHSSKPLQLVKPSFLPEVIEVGLHAAALSPGCYREYYAKRIKPKQKSTMLNQENLKVESHHKGL